MAATPEHAARVLGLDETASMDDVRRARREFAMKYHPDRRPDVTTSSRHMARVNAAADTLIAHIRDKAKLASKARQPQYTDFSNSRASKPKNRGRTVNAQGSTAAKPDLQTNISSTERGSRTVALRQPLAAPLVPERSGRDNDLIRLAARSYRTVLQQITQPDRGPTVDARALRFKTAV
ncbi:J domain-containing protein [Roseobacter litoralis]|uniref:J domain-containing protein n=1 Tax=Roseobacter litoralis TaxID=42443 RepID=UPI002495807B|nr:J domain-containing protein [Roseobacter litoralis]